MRGRYGRYSSGEGDRVDRRLADAVLWYADIARVGGALGGDGARHGLAVSRTRYGERVGRRLRGGAPQRRVRHGGRRRDRPVDQDGPLPYGRPARDADGALPGA